MSVLNRCFNEELTKLEMPPESVNYSTSEAGEKEKKRKQEMQSFSAHSLQHFDSVGHASCLSEADYLSNSEPEPICPSLNSEVFFSYQ